MRVGTACQEAVSVSEGGKLGVGIVLEQWWRREWVLEMRMEEWESVVGKVV